MTNKPPTATRHARGSQLTVCLHFSLPYQSCVRVDISLVNPASCCLTHPLLTLHAQVLSLLSQAGSVERNNMRVTDAFGAHPLVFAVYTAPSRGGEGGGGGGEIAGGRGPSGASLQDLRQRELRRLRDVDPGGDNMATPF